MALSSHPLPAAALEAPVLQRIYEVTPRAPRARSRAALAKCPAPAVPAEEPSRCRARRLAERYRLAEYLDSGGTADVFAALDEATGARVAIKILNQSSAADPLLRRYFLTGARAALGAVHPNLLRVHSVHEPEEGAPFAVMEIVTGRALSKLLAEAGPLAPERAVELALQAAAGLDAAHRKGLIHCDVKPENLLVAGDAAGELALKVIDFDLAAVCDEEGAHEHPLLRGTAKYMAPEQAIGDRVDARTDVYALGVVLFKMLTGHLPFELDLSATLLWHQLASPIPPLSWLREGLDPRLEAIVARALRKAPENRYPTMSLLLADLHALSGGGPLLAERPLAAPDVYVPRSEGARNAARALERCVQRRAG